MTLILNLLPEMILKIYKRGFPDILLVSKLIKIINLKSHNNEKFYQKHNAYLRQGYLV